MPVCWEPENFLRQSVLGWPLLAVQKRAFGAFNPTTSPTPTGLHYWEDGGGFILRLTKGLERWFSD